MHLIDAFASIRRIARRGGGSRWRREGNEGKARQTIQAPAQDNKKKGKPPPFTLAMHLIDAFASIRRIARRGGGSRWRREGNEGKARQTIQAPAQDNATVITFMNYLN